MSDTKDRATARPWRLEEDAYGHRPAVFAGQDANATVVAECDNTDYDEAMANARLIVRVVNVYDDTARLLLRIANDSATPYHLRNEARALLARLEGDSK